VPGGSLPAPDVAAGLRALVREDMLAIEGRDAVSGRPRRWFAPRSLAALDRLCARHPQATIVAGATDVGLWVTKQQRELDTVIWLGEVAELRRIEEDADGLTLGAGTRYTQARGPLARLHPQLGALVGRIGGLQVRNSGTIGGNIANGSPIGDMPPALIALGATLTLRRGEARRTLALEDFFIAYGEQDRTPGEFIEAVTIPRPGPEDRLRAYKVAKRFDSDISAVCAGLALELDGETIVDARLAYGGMAATVRRAAAAEAALRGRRWDEAALAEASAALASDFRPITDMRASAGYRMQVAQNLLRRFWLETQGVPDASLETLTATETA
jgi:xanthine dehydrogenase small subunit